jgi:hypothetical protein
MRRPFAIALASLLSVGFLVVPWRAANAQEPALRLTLLQQTPEWNNARNPTVSIRFRAENTGAQTFEELSVGVTILSPVRSRTAFEESMAGDLAGAAVLFGDAQPRRGVLAPGETRDFEVSVDLPVAQLSSAESLLYPLKIDLRSGFQSLAAIRTPVIFLVRQPLVPVALSWTFVLNAQLTIRPDGVFASRSLEASISRGGRLAGQIAALSRLAAARVRVDVVVSPLLLYQLVRMSEGYRVVDGTTVRTVQRGRDGSATAAAALRALRAIAAAPTVELSALPFAEPLLPALTSGGLAHDLGVQVQRGRELVADVLGREPVTSVFRPPRSALDAASLDDLPGQGVSTLLLDPAVVRRPEDPQGFAPSPLVTLASQNATLTGVVGDPALQALLVSGAGQQDPALAAQILLGELAEIWMQQPGQSRGLAMILGEQTAAGGAFFGRLGRAVAGAPWLAERSASALADDPALQPQGAVSDIVPAPSAFSQEYVGSIKQARRLVETLRTMLARPSEQPERLEQLLLLAESQRFVNDESSGSAYVRRASATVRSVFAAVRPEVAQSITLTSSSIRNVPIAVRNAAPVPLRTTIRLTSPHLVGSVERTRVLPPRSTTTVTMDLHLKTTGRFEVNVDVFAPTGRQIGHTTLVVRSTAYNRVALLITIGAAALGMLVWARRFLPRRND